MRFGRMQKDYRRAATHKFTDEDLLESIKES